MECSNGPTDGARNVTLATAENRTNVTLMCFPARSCVTLSVGNVTLITIQVHSNVTLAARNVTLMPERAESRTGKGLSSSRAGGQVLPAAPGSARVPPHRSQPGRTRL